MYFTYKGYDIEIYAADCDEKNDLFYWAAFCTLPDTEEDVYLGDRFLSFHAAHLAAIQRIELSRIYYFTP